jgi:hypothetical protein
MQSHSEVLLGTRTSIHTFGEEDKNQPILIIKQAKNVFMAAEIDIEWFLDFWRAEFCRSSPKLSFPYVFFNVCCYWYLKYPLGWSQ